MFEQIASHITEIIAVLTTISGFVIGRKLRKVDVENREIEGLKTIIEIQRSTIDRMNERILMLEKKVYKLKPVIFKKDEG